MAVPHTEIPPHPVALIWSKVSGGLTKAACYGGLPLVPKTSPTSDRRVVTRTLCLKERQKLLMFLMMGPICTIPEPPHSQRVTRTCRYIMYTKTEKAHYADWGVHLLIGPFVSTVKILSFGQRSWCICISHLLRKESVAYILHVINVQIMQMRFSLYLVLSHTQSRKRNSSKKGIRWNFISSQQFIGDLQPNSVWSVSQNQGKLVEAFNSY